jgi:hypothetical protein
MRPFEPVHKEVWQAVYDFIRRRSSLEDVSLREAEAHRML